MCRMSRNYYHYLHIRRYTTFFQRWIYKSRNKVLNLLKKNVYPSISVSNSCCYCYFIREKLCKSIITAKSPSEPKAQYFFPHRLFIILSPLRPLSAPPPFRPIINRHSSEIPHHPHPEITVQEIFHRRHYARPRLSRTVPLAVGDTMTTLPCGR